MLHCTIFFSLWWTMVEMAIYTQKCEPKWLKINNRGGWNKDVLGGKKNQKIHNRGEGGGGGRLFGTPEYLLIVSVFHFLNFLNSKQIFLITFLHQYVHLWKRKYAAIFSLQTNTRVNCFHVTEKNILLIIEIIRYD